MIKNPLLLKFNATIGKIERASSNFEDSKLLKL